MECINLTQDRHKRRAPLKTKIKFHIAQMRKISWLVEQLLASEERIRSLGVIVLKHMPIYIAAEIIKPLAH
jgi:hypothetical protein